MERVRGPAEPDDRAAHRGSLRAVRGTSDPAGAEESGRRTSSRVPAVLLVTGLALLVGAAVLALAP